MKLRMWISEYWEEMGGALIHTQCAESFSSPFWYLGVFDNPISHKDVRTNNVGFGFFLSDFVFICFAVRVTAEERSPQVLRL